MTGLLRFLSGVDVGERGREGEKERGMELNR